MIIRENARKYCVKWQNMLKCTGLITFIELFTQMGQQVADLIMTNCLFNNCE